MRVLPTDKFGRVYFESAAYKRSKNANSFVKFSHNNRQSLGEILFFVSVPSEGIPARALVKLFDIVEEIGTVKGVLYRVAESNYEDVKPVEALEKFFCVNDFYKQELFLVTICSLYEHS